MNPYKDRSYIIVPYDPAWLTEFEALTQRIKNIFGSDIQVEHIGSTSVPGMSGKPCIDLLVLVPNLEVVDELRDKMQQDSFEFANSPVDPSAQLFRIVINNSVVANIHFFPIGHPHIIEMLNLRDYFRSHPNEAVTYSNLKNELYAKYPDDYASYRKYKDYYMNSLKKDLGFEPK